MSHDAPILRDLRSDGVTRLVFNRPQTRNALDGSLIDALIDHLDVFSRDDQQRVLVITGSGSSFCAGGNLEEMADIADAPSGQQRDYLWRHIHRIPRAFEQLEKPVIAAVNGAAYGAGMDIALMCDLRIAARSARLSSSYINLGLVAGDGGAFFLARLVGIQRSLELLWTGRVVAADEALAIGLFGSVVDDDQLPDAAIALALQIAAQPPEPIRMMKRAVYDAPSTNLRSHLDMVASHMSVLYDSEAFKTRMKNLGRKV
jgi:enoyl-CoA hydratase/carnithine racemase